MGRKSLRACLTAVLVTVMLVAGMGNRLMPGVAASPPPQRLVAQTPDAVAGGSAQFDGPHAPQAMLTLNIGLRTRNAAALDGIIAAAHDPSSPTFGHYLTNDQYMADFAPTADEVQAVRDWATTAGFTLIAVSPDRLLVTVRATVRQIEAALGVAINDYSLGALSFRSNDRDPLVPGTLAIRAISGLSTLHRFHTMLTRSRTMRGGGYYPGDFRAAYNAVAPVADGSGQTIGFTLWGTSVASGDLSSFASQTGTPAIVSGQAGANGIDWIPVNGGSSDTNELVETAMDVEYAHGMAPNSHLKYWLGDCTPGIDPNTGGPVCNPSDAGLEQAISAAANDPSLHIVSNSWGGGEALSATDPFVSNTGASFQHAASVGTTFYFSSGDSGSNSGGTGLPSYPADSPYVVSVGGTTLNTGAGFAYASESAWSGSGGGCSLIFSRPSWQTGVGAATCSGRAVPDISADADPATGAYVWVQSVGQQIGGTSLAAPLWAGMAANLNRYLGTAGKPLMGFAATRLYQLAGTAATYTRDFHDVTSGNNGYPAGPGWDQATGWGSVNLANLAADWSPAPPPNTTTPLPPTATATAVRSATPVPPTATSTATPAPPTATATRTSTAVPPTATLTPAPPSATSTTTPIPPTATATTAPASSTASPIPPTATATRPATAVPPTASLTPVPPTSTRTATPLPPTATATLTPVPPTATRTPVPPTATRTPTPVPPTATYSSTPVPPTATATPVPPSATPTPAGGVVNGDFETGTLAGWTPGGAAASVATTGCHAGSYCAQLGSTSPTNGDSTLAQTFTVPANGTSLSFWYRIVCPDSVTYDWATATLKDTTTGATTTILPQTCTNSGAWVQASAAVTGGHSYTLTLVSHDDNYTGDATYTLFDDISIIAGSPPPPSATPTPAGGVVNGDFETGTLAGWTPGGAAASVATTGCHAGSYCAQLGSTSPTNGDSTLAQTFTVPAGKSTLSLWYANSCPDTVTYDWATATLKDTAAGTTTTILPQTCAATSAWTSVSAPVTPGHSYTLTLVSHDDNYGSDPTYTRFDDITLN